MSDTNQSITLNLPADMAAVSAVAAAVSGGPDSMALAFLMRGWAAAHHVDLHVLSVDHGLRSAAADEVLQVGNIVSEWDGVTHHVLTYSGEKPDRAIQEEARNLRYDLMAKKCAALGVRHLCLAHHQDDQGETLLFRLAKGSGLDGLCSMRPVAEYSDDLMLVRPLLNVAKADLVALCMAQGIEYIEDPSNENAEFARVRMRAAREALEAEGLSNKRLARTAKRLQRAQEALDRASDGAFIRAVSREGAGYVLDISVLRGEAEEIAFRVFLRVVQSLRADAAYQPRMEKLEALFDDFWAGENNGRDDFRKRTLGGLVFDVLDFDKIGGGVLRVSLEKK